MACSLVPAVLLLMVSTTTVPSTIAIRPTASNNSSLTKACNKTTYVSTCIDVLLDFSPESKTASPHRVAELAYQYLLKHGSALSMEIQSAVAAAAKKKVDEGYRNCLNTLNGNVKDYLSSVSRFAPEKGEDQFAKAKKNLKEILDYPSNTGVACPENAIEAEPVVKKTYVYESMLQDTLDLMKAAAHTAGPVLSI